MRISFYILFGSTSAILCYDVVKVLFQLPLFFCTRILSKLRCLISYSII